MKQKVYSFIGAVIIISGLFWYMQMHFKEYHIQQKLEASIPVGSSVDTDALEVNGFLEKGNDLGAIDKLIQMVEADPDDLGVKLKLTQVYCNQCILDTLNCENAMWQLNSILKSNPNQKDALIWKNKLSLFLSDTLSLRSE